MKYTIETHGCGYTETLEFKGKVYKKEHEGDPSHTSTDDKDFCDQMEAEGISNDELLDEIYNILDGSFLGFDLLGIADEWEES